VRYVSEFEICRPKTVVQFAFMSHEIQVHPAEYAFCPWIIEIWLTEM